METNEAWKECPRSAFCNLNKCIFHPDYDSLENSPEDPAIKHKQKCIPKSIRKRIALKYNLSNGGLTSRERKSAERWANMPENEKAERISKLQENSPISRLNLKGYAITRKKQISSNLHGQNDKNRPQQASETPILNEDEVSNE